MAAADLPLLLCGPMLRRVEPRAVSVWVALSESATVSVELFTDIVDVGTGPEPATPPRAPFASDGVVTRRIGDHLHLALVTVKLDQNAGRVPLLPGTLYSYNVVIATGSGTHDLRSLGLLQDTGGAGGGSDGSAPIAPEPLGYENGRLPGFATVPAKLEQLNFAHASCSKMHGNGDPLLAQVDDIIKDNRDRAVASDDAHPSRPHQLFLTGDQIYADDVATALLATLNQVGHALIGESTRETVAVNAAGTEQNLEVTCANFPPGRRQVLMTSVAKFTSEAAASHLISFSEFAAMYCLSWSPAAWPRVGNDLQLGTMATWPEPKLKTGFDAREQEAWQTNEDLRARPQPPHDDKFVNRTVLDAAATSPIDAQLTPFFSAAPDPSTDPKDWNQLERAASVGLKKARIAFIADRKKIEDTATSIWKIRRTLANVPTYAICDDHEVTDDWNLTQRWRATVFGSSLGKSVLRNALTAYTLFQGWGNDPAAFADPASVNAGCLNDAAALFPAGGGTWPSAAATANLETCFGLGAGDPKIRFDYVIDGNAHRAIVMDSRTRRAFAGLDAPPALLSDDALRDQIQRGPFPSPLPAGVELLLVISPAPMVGPPLFEETLLPLAIRGFDANFMAVEKRTALSVERAMIGIDRTKPTGAQFLDAEGWSNNPRALEKMLAALAGYNAPVVVLAGDVHYAASFAIDYQAAGKPTVRIAHLTSSAAQNVWPDAVCSFMSSIAWGRSLTGARSPARKFGWAASTPEPLADLGGEWPPLVGRAKRHPVLLPENGWRKHHAFTRPPDWQWSLTELIDTRNDADRPLKARPEALPSGDVTSAMHPGGGSFGYRALAHAHVNSMDLMFLRRGTVFSNNYGNVSFLRDNAGVVSVKHALHSIRPHKDPGEDDEDYTVHLSSLAPTAPAAATGIG
jgi:hypothetical protein